MLDLFARICVEESLISSGNLNGPCSDTTVRRLCDTIDARGDAKRLKNIAHRLDPHMGRVVSETWLKSAVTATATGITDLINLMPGSSSHC
jgi:hypothetical protein